MSGKEEILSSFKDLCGDKESGPYPIKHDLLKQNWETITRNNRGFLNPSVNQVHFRQEN